MNRLLLILLLSFTASAELVLEITQSAKQPIKIAVLQKDANTAIGEHNGPVIFDCHVDPNENCFPMIPSGKPHNQMILGPSDKEENKITGKGKALV